MSQLSSLILIHFCDLNEQFACINTIVQIYKSLVGFLQTTLNDCLATLQLTFFDPFCKILPCNVILLFEIEYNEA